MLAWEHCSLLSRYHLYWIHTLQDKRHGSVPIALYTSYVYPKPESPVKGKGKGKKQNKKPPAARVSICAGFVGCFPRAMPRKIVTKRHQLDPKKIGMTLQGARRDCPGRSQIQLQICVSFLSGRDGLICCCPRCSHCWLRVCGRREHDGWSRRRSCWCVSLLLFSSIRLFLK
jgi:hypothetical protein